MSQLTVQHSAGISTVTVGKAADSPSGSSVVSDLMAALGEADLSPDTDAVLLTSELDSFGLNEERTEQAGSSMPLVRSPGWQLLYRIVEMEKPFICVVDSAAIDLGLAIVLLSDTTVAADSAVVGCRGVTEAVSGQSELAVLLPLYLGPQRAKEMVIAGELVSATEAHRLGLVNRTAGKSDLREQGEAVASLYASRPKFAARATKVVVNRYIRWMADELGDVAMAYEAMARSQTDPGSDFDR